MAFYVGLDSGGTKTECWLGDEQRVLARAMCGTAKLTRVGQEVATARMRSLLKEVSAQAGVGLDRLTRSCVGVAGFSIVEVREWAARTVGELASGEVLVVGDDEIALDAAFQGGSGILLIGGTGSAVVGRCGDGTKFTAGGWGPAIGDEGSGYWIGKEAVRRAFTELDRGRRIPLLDAIRVAWGWADVGGVVGFANARPGPDFAALAPVVVECAANGDAVARAVLESAGRELALQVETVWRRMRIHGETAAQVAYTGSVLEKIETVRSRMVETLAERYTELEVVDGAVNAIEGAMWRARGGRAAA
jgi:N-acetylglucosamine kinase-like BadF-type ATPase